MTGRVVAGGSVTMVEKSKWKRLSNVKVLPSEVELGTDLPVLGRMVGGRITVFFELFSAGLGLRGTCSVKATVVGTVGMDVGPAPAGSYAGGSSWRSNLGRWALGGIEGGGTRLSVDAVPSNLGPLEYGGSSSPGCGASGSATCL